MSEYEEIREKQLNRLLKHGGRAYTVEEHAEEMIQYAKSKGIDLVMSQYSFLYTVKLQQRL